MLAVSLVLAGDARLVVGARIVLALVGVAMLLGRATTTARWTPPIPHPAALLAPPIVAVLIAGWAAIGPDRPLGSEAASLAGIVVTAAR